MDKNNDREIRTFAAQELRAEDGENGPKITGYAAVFNAPSEKLGYEGFIEYILPGAFARAVQEDDVRALFNHDENYPLGRTRAGTLRLAEDEVGLRFEIDPPDTQYARDLMASMKRGDVDQMSFAFRAIKDEWKQEPNGPIERSLIELMLYDVSPVTFPAYPQTSAYVRSMLENFAGEAQEGEPDTNQEKAEIMARLQVRRALIDRKLAIIYLQNEVKS